MNQGQHPADIRKVPPFNYEAEQAVLGSVFQSRYALDGLIEILNVEDFYSQPHRIIFQLFLDLHKDNTPIDLVTVSSTLDQQGQLGTVGGPVYLFELADSPVSAANSKHHAKIVRDKSIQRSVIEVGTDMISSSYDAWDVKELLEGVEQSVFAIADKRSAKSYSDCKQLVASVFDKIEDLKERNSAVTGVPTGGRELDEITCGLQNTDLIILAGRPSMGKTALALSMSLYASGEYQVPTAIFSLEMGEEQLAQRLICSKAKVNLQDVRRGHISDEDMRKLYTGADYVASLPMFIDDTPALTTLDLRARARRLKREHYIGLVVVDYLQLMRSSQKGLPREQEIADISRSLKGLAKELKIPVVALSQLNRKVEERTDKRPMLSDLRESGAIEQDADVIMMIYRDEVYNKNEDNPNRGIAEVIVAKQRNGPTGKARFAFLKEFTAFENLAQRI